MAVRVSPDQVEANAATTKRAMGYLRWYPSAWRERYGEEFTAHLEVELTERPVSIARTTDIVMHGLFARLSLQRGARIAVGALVVAILVTAGIVSAILLNYRSAPVAITSGYNGGTTGVGLVAPPSQVNDLSYDFSTHSRTAIRITSITLVSLPGFRAPQLVGAEFERRASELANARGWPIRFSKGASLAAGGQLRLVRAIGAPVRLARSDALWLGFRAPKIGTAYAVEMVRVSYVLRGTPHTMVINQGGSPPDVICSSNYQGSATPRWCSNEQQLADEVGEFVKHPYVAQDEVQLVSSIALNDVQRAGVGVPKLVAVLDLAARLYPSSGPHAILSIVGVVNNGVPEWRFVVQTKAHGSPKVLCTTRGSVAHGAEAGVKVIAPSEYKNCAAKQSGNE
jgi:hypothetical protein